MWFPATSVTRNYPNFSHGTAGVAYFLATLYQRTRDQAFLDGALAGATYLDAVATKRDGTRAIFHVSGGGEDRYYLSWCHGPVGTARLFYRLLQITGDAKWRQWIDELTAAVAKSGVPERQTPGYWNNISQCCGNVGIGQYCIDLARHHKSPAIAALLERVERNTIARATDDADGFRWLQAENRVAPEKSGRADRIHAGCGRGRHVLSPTRRVQPRAGLAHAVARHAVDDVMRGRSRRWLAVTAMALALWAAAPALQTAETAFGQSLMFRADRVIVDPTHPAVAWLGQSRPEPYRSTGALRLRVTLRRDQPDTPLAKDLGETVIFGGNLAEHPVPINVNLTGVADGDYEYVAEITDGPVRVALRRLKVKLVSGLDEQHAATERRLAKIAGHDSAKASIRYPFDLARVINLGRRMLTSGAGNPEFGLKQNGEPVRYDFAAGLARSATLLASLERGADPVWRKGGETVRHYYMPEADEILPYHVFVPSRWNGRSALPLVFILHGNSRDQDFYFERDERIIPRTADRHGYMVVAPLGYSPNAGYNYVPYGRATIGPRGLAGAAATSQVFGPADETAGGSRRTRPGRGVRRRERIGDTCRGAIRVERAGRHPRPRPHPAGVSDRSPPRVPLRVFSRRPGRPLSGSEVSRSTGRPSPSADRTRSRPTPTRTTGSGRFPS